ncbi:MAG: hypothetical protein AMXMBFR13_28050 [Phycisphaerae bacterium]
MEKDPQVVARLALQRRDENWRFRTFVKHLSAKRLARLEALSNRLGHEAEAQMDCTTCGACCRVNHVPVEPDEIERLASLAKLPVLDFRRQYLDTDDDGDPALPAPCPFLDGARCTVYEDRPVVCREYPYIDGDIVWRMMAILERVETCPIVFEMLERLKEQSGFHRYR